MDEFGISIIRLNETPGDRKTVFTWEFISNSKWRVYKRSFRMQPALLRANIHQYRGLISTNKHSPPWVALRILIRR